MGVGISTGGRGSELVSPDMSELCSLKLPMWHRTRDTGVKANTEEEETVNRTLRVAGVWEAAREHSPAE